MILRIIKNPDNNERVHAHKTNGGKTSHQQRQPAIPPVKLRGLALLLVQRANAATRYAKLSSCFKTRREKNEKRKQK
jgi:hypothetical protein